MLQGKKEYAPPPRDPSFLGLSPDPEVTEQKTLWFIPFPGKTREKGIHHRSGKKGIHHRASDPEKEKEEGLHGGGVYFFLPCVGRRTEQAKAQGGSTSGPPSGPTSASTSGHESAHERAHEVSALQGLSMKAPKKRPTKVSTEGNLAQSQKMVRTVCNGAGPI